MASVIKIKRNNSAGVTPSGGDLQAGELAVNTADGLLFTSSNGSDVVSLGMTAANIQAHAALANTNAAIATKLASASYTTADVQAKAALANTNAQIATKLASASYTTADVQAKAALANTNARATSLEAATTSAAIQATAALANTNTAIATKLASASYTAADVQAKAALANTNDFIAAVKTDSAAWNNATDTLTFTRGDSSTYTVALSGFPSDSVSNTYLQATFTANSVIGAQLSNTNAAIALRATEANSLLRLSNTNAYIATKLNTSSYTAADVQAKAALANTNDAIGLRATEANSLLRLSNTNAYIATKLNSSSYTTADVQAKAALANTNDQIGNLIDGTTAFSAVNIDGGAIEGANVTVGAGKTLNVSAGTLTLAADQISGDSINGGTISTFASTGIDDNATGTKITVTDSQTTLDNAVNITGALTVDGNLTVEGTVTYIGTTTVNVEDNMMKLSANNVADTVDTGVYGKYVESATTKYAGYFRDATDDVFKFFDGLTQEPTTTANTAHASYATATIEAVIDGGTF